MPNSHATPICSLHFFIATYRACSSLLSRPLAAVESFKDSGCGIERVDGSRLTFESFEKLILARPTPVIVRNIPGTAELRANSTPHEILAAHGDDLVQLEAGIDETKASFKLSKRWRRLRDYVEHPTGGPELAFELGLLGSISRSIWSTKVHAVPTIVKHLMANTMLTIGNKASGTNMHRHDESWVLMLHGRKAWWIGVPDTTNDQYFGSVSPCVHLGAEMPPGFQFCVQQPGELLYFPKLAYHATCNLDDFSWGIGAQGRTSDWSSLIHDATHGDVESVRASFASVAPVPSVTRADYSAALQRALALGQYKVVDELLKHAAKMLKAADGVVVNERHTTSPLHAVIQSGDAASVNMLLRIGENPEARFNKHVATIPFDMASLLGHTEIVALLKDFPGPLLKDYRDMILSYSAYNAARYGHMATLKQLRSFGAKMTSVSVEGRLPLHGAAASGQIHLVKKLLGKSAVGLNSQDQEFNTVLHGAAEQGHAEVSTFLIGLRADVYKRNRKGQQALHLAAEQGHMLMVDCLLNISADVNSKGFLSSTPLHFATHSGSVLVAELLLNHRADLDIRDQSGFQPLHIAAHRGRKLFADLLVRSNAEINTLGPGDQTPLAIAQQAGHEPLINYLLQKQEQKQKKQKTRKKQQIQKGEIEQKKQEKQEKHKMQKKRIQEDL